MSPCIGICQMDDASGYCIGCGRTLEEISNWGSTPTEQRQQTMSTLPNRLGQTPASESPTGN
jgi:predicted Fe-S protein YdhL (DUF1289 family)